MLFLNKHVILIFYYDHVNLSVPVAQWVNFRLGCTFKNMYDVNCTDTLKQFYKTVSSQADNSYAEK